MLAENRRSLLLVGVLATALAFPAAAEMATTQQIALGQAAGLLAAQQADTQAPVTILQTPPELVQDNYATEAAGRPLPPAAGNRAHLPARAIAHDRRPARYVVSARRSCGHLGCRGGFLALGVGY